MPFSPLHVPAFARRIKVHDRHSAGSEQEMQPKVTRSLLKAKALDGVTELKVASISNLSLMRV